MVFFELLHPIGIDFPQYYEAAVMFIRGLNPYQTLLTSPGPFNYPPPSVFFLFWLGLLPYNLAGVIWNIASLLSFIFSILIILKISKNYLTIPQSLIPIALFTLPFFPEKFNLGNGQINNFILLMCVSSFYLYFRGKTWSAATLLALATSIKLVPLVYILAFIFKKDYRFVAKFFTTLAILFATAFLVIPARFQHLYYSDIVFRATSFDGKGVYYNQSLLGFLSRSNIASLYPVLAIALFLLSLKKMSIINYQLSISLSTCLYLILHPLTWQHHFVFAVIPLIILWSQNIPKLWLIISYLLLASNIKDPASVPVLFQSHQFYGVFILWALHWYNHKHAKNVLGYRDASSRRLHA